MKQYYETVDVAEQGAIKTGEDVFQKLRIDDILPPMDAVHKRIFCETVDKAIRANFRPVSLSDLAIKLFEEYSRYRNNEGELEFNDWIKQYQFTH